MRALVAEDDRVTAEILSRTLKRWEFDSLRARPGFQRLLADIEAEAANSRSPPGR